MYCKELQDPGNFPELMAENLAKDSSLHLLVPIKFKGKHIKSPTVMVLHSFRAPPKKVKNPICRSQKPATQLPLSVPFALHESAEEKEEFRCCHKSIDLYKVKSGGHIMEVFTLPPQSERTPLGHSDSPRTVLGLCSDFAQTFMAESPAKLNVQSELSLSVRAESEWTSARTVLGLSELLI